MISFATMKLSPQNGATESTGGFTFAQRCSCWRTGVYCSLSAAGPAPYLWWLGHPGASQFFNKESNRLGNFSFAGNPSLNPTSSSTTTAISSAPPAPPVELKHFYAVQELRDAIRELWTTSSLSETIPENSKVFLIVTISAFISSHILCFF